MGGRRSARAAAAAFAAAALVGSGGCAPFAETQSSGGTVLLAADLELSGSGERLGATYRNALELRVEHINQQGLLGDVELRVEIRDNRSDPVTAGQNLAALVGDPTVTAIISGGCADCLLAAVPAIEAAGVPTISLAPDRSVVAPSAERRSVFQLVPTAAGTAGALLAQMTATQVGSLAILAADDGHGEEGVAELIGAAERSGVEVAVTRLVASDEDLLNTAAAEVAAWEPLSGFEDSAEPAGPDAVAVWAPPELAGSMANALRAAGFDGSLYFAAHAVDDMILPSQHIDAIQGGVAVLTEVFVIDEVIATTPARAARKRWFNDYLAHHGTYHAAASFAADAVDLVVDAIRRADSTDRAAVRAAIETTRRDGLSGAIRITPDNHSGLDPQALTAVVARGDRWRLAG